MSTSIIPARLRTRFTKSERNQIRRSGGVLASLYGKNTAPRSLFFDVNAVKAVVSSGHGLIRIEVEGDRTYSAVIKQIEHHPMRPSQIIHIDLHSVDLDEYIEAEVSIILNGLENVEKAGGIILQHTREVNIRALPTQMPEFLQADISNLEPGNHFHVKDLVLPQGCSLREPGDTVVASVVAAGSPQPDAPEIPKEPEIDHA